jgi:type I restriction enzyme S subunit
MSEKQTVKFGDICREVKLTTKDPIADGYERYIGLEHLDSSSLKIKRWGMIAEDNPSFTRVFKKGHFLFGKRRPYLKKAAIAEFDGICSGDIIVMEPISSNDGGLINLILTSNKFWSWAVKNSSGSLSPRTKFKSIAELEFSLPNSGKIKNQCVAFDKIFKMVQFADEAYSSAVALRQSARAKLLYNGRKGNKLIKSHWGCVPKGWDLLPFNKVAEINPTYKVLSGVVKFCEMSLVGTDSRFIYGDLESRSSDGGGARFKNGDLLFARITPCAENGKMAIVDFLDDGEVGKGSTEFIVLSPKIVSPFYLYSLCRTARIREYAIARMEGTTGRQRIPAYIFESLMIPIPPESEREEVEKCLLQIELQVESALLKKNKINDLMIRYSDSVFGE